VSHYIPC